MPSPTFVAIATTTVGSGGASSIDFTSIPQTYTDLVIKASLRDNLSGYAGDDIIIRFNNDTTSSYSWRRLSGNGTAASSDNSTSATYNLAGYSTAVTATASTFGNLDIYIPNYVTSNNKSSSVDSVSENNATTAYAALNANLWSKTDSITSIKLLSANLANFVQYSTATLYGIKNS